VTHGTRSPDSKVAVQQKIDLKGMRVAFLLGHSVLPEAVSQFRHSARDLIVLHSLLKLGHLKMLGIKRSSSREQYRFFGVRLDKQIFDVANFTFGNAS
jgi:hypothetical protein